MRSADDRAALHALLALDSLTPRRLLELSNECRTARTCLEAVRAGRGASDADQSRARALDPKEIAARVSEAGARLVAVGEAEYPAALLDLFDPPAGLFVRGAPLSPLRTGVGIVGARNCSPGGRDVAISLGRALAGAGACVVSGAARGIDAAAHRGALEGHGSTLAVLGSGIDVFYPSQNRTLIERIATSGTVLSEYPPGTRAEPFRFPARNRLVAALSVAVVVVEGAQGSGSMITADHALDLGREVFAVPGAVSTALAQVPLALIREGAALIRGPDDLLGDLGLAAKGMGDAPEGERHSGPPANLPDANGRRVWDALTFPSTADRLAGQTGMALFEVVASLIRMELRGAVRQVGGRFERVGGGAEGF